MKSIEGHGVAHIRASLAASSLARSSEAFVAARRIHASSCVGALRRLADLAGESRSCAWAALFRTRPNRTGRGRRIADDQFEHRQISSSSK